MNTLAHPFLAFLGPIGGPELIVIFLVILLLFGAKKIPELARGVGKGMGEFKKAKEDFEAEIKAGEEDGKRDWDKKTTHDDDHGKEGRGEPKSTHPAAKED